MTSYKKGKGPGPLQRGQQTLAMFMAKSGNSLIPAPCAICGKNFDAKRISFHLERCSKKVSGDKMEEVDSDVEIIEEVKSPLTSRINTPRRKSQRQSTRPRRKSELLENRLGAGENRSQRTPAGRKGTDCESPGATMVPECKSSKCGHLTEGRRHQISTANGAGGQRQSSETPANVLNDNGDASGSSDRLAQAYSGKGNISGADGPGSSGVQGVQVPSEMIAGAAVGDGSAAARCSAGGTQAGQTDRLADTHPHSSSPPGRTRGTGHWRPGNAREREDLGVPSNLPTPKRGGFGGRGLSEDVAAAMVDSSPHSVTSSPSVTPSQSRTEGLRMPGEWSPGRTPLRVRRQLYQPASRMMCEAVFSSPESKSPQSQETVSLPISPDEKHHRFGGTSLSSCVEKFSSQAGWQDCQAGVADDRVVRYVTNGGVPSGFGGILTRMESRTMSSKSDGGPSPTIEAPTLKIVSVDGADHSASVLGVTPLTSPLKSDAPDAATGGIDSTSVSTTIADDCTVDDAVLSQEFGSEMSEPRQPSSPQKDAIPYYLENFLFIMDSVLEDDMNRVLLDASDLDVIQQLRGLSAPAQMLYVRLFQRKPAWIREDRIRYPELAGSTAVSELLTELTAADLLLSERELTTADQLTQLLTAPELRQLCHQLHLSSAGTRETLLGRLAQHGRGQRVMFAASASQVVADRARVVLGRCAKVAAEPRRVLTRVLSLFSTPSYEDEESTSQQLRQLLMVRLGQRVYPEALVRKEAAVFGCRADLLRYEAASRLEAETRDAVEAKNFEEAYQGYLKAEELWREFSSDSTLLVYDEQLPTFLRKFTASSVLTYTRFRGVELLQRRKEYGAAVALLRELLSQQVYLPDYRGLWWDRLALNLHQHLRDVPAASAAVRQALDDPQVRGGRRLSLEQRAVHLRLSSLAGPPVLQPTDLPSVTISAACLPENAPGRKSVFLCRDGGASGEVSIGSVEEVALAHYRTEGYPEGLHAESAPTTTLFALLFWDVLYRADVADSFRCPFQAVPLDLNSDFFYGRRQQAVDGRLSELLSGSLETACDRVAAVWEANHGCLSLAAWHVFRDAAHAQTLLHCLGLPLVVAICRRLATEYRFARSGFPDLVVWSPESGTARIVEVKSPNDRLSTKQQLWLQYLLRHGAAAEVCYVRATGGRRSLVGRPDPSRGIGEPGNRERGTREPGTRYQGTTEPGIPDRGTAEPGTPDRGHAEPETRERGTGEPGTRERDTGEVDQEASSERPRRAVRGRKRKHVAAAESNGVSSPNKASQRKNRLCRASTRRASARDGAPPGDSGDDFA